MVGLWYWVSHMHLFFGFFWMYNSVSIRRKHLFESDDGWSCLPNNPQQKIRINPLWVFVNYIYTSESPKKADVLNMNWISSTRVAPTHDRCMGSHLWRGFWQFWFFIEPSGVLEAIFSILKMIIFLVIYSFRCCPHHYGWYIPMKHTWLVVWDIFLFFHILRIVIPAD